MIIVTKNDGPKISKGLLAFFLVGTVLFVVIITLIVILTGNARWAIIAGIILFILLSVSKILVLVILTNKKSKK